MEQSTSRQLTEATLRDVRNGPTILQTWQRGPALERFEIRCMAVELGVDQQKVHKQRKSQLRQYVGAQEAIIQSRR